MEKITRYFIESWQELLKVKWPTRKQMVELTTIVLGLTLVMSLFTGAFDILFGWSYGLLLKLSGK